MVPLLIGIYKLHQFSLNQFSGNPSDKAEVMTEIK